MIKIICDRCGKELKQGASANDNELHFTKKRNTRFGYDDLLQLCDNCLEDFDKFMKEKKDGVKRNN